MFNLFKSPPKTGTDAIHEAIGQFEDIAARLEVAAVQNDSQATSNLETINTLIAENKSLDAASARGRSVAAKLRDLIS